MRKNLKIKIIITALAVVFFWLFFIQTNFFSFLFQLTFNRDINLKTVDNRINVLLLGTSGQNHEGPNLTDTIIIANLNPIDVKVTLISIPRDLWTPDLKGKINTAYAVGENKKTGGGLILAKSAVSKILNQPVEYAVRLNFEGFVQSVNLVGGLDTDITNAFDDYEYPVEGKENDPCGHKDTELDKLATASSQLEAFPCRYKHIHFDKGSQHLNGEMALEFVRSRHAKGEEGTDFARSRRQEKIINAFKDKILSPLTILNPAKFISLYTILRGNIDTDINQNEFDDFVRLTTKLKNAKVETAVLDYGNVDHSGLLINPPITSEYNYEWTLIPRTGNGKFEEIQKYIDCEIKIGNCSISSKY